MLIELIRKLKLLIFSPELSYRQVRLGIAQGLLLPMSRRDNLRMELGIFEYPIIRPIKAYARAARVAYDLGSAEGYYVLALCRLMGPDGYVVAFDSDAQQLKHLEEVLVINGLTHRVHCVHGFVGNGVAEDSVAIDDLIHQKAIPPAQVIKMDIEGAEFEALKGMRATIEKYKPNLIIEVHAAETEKECVCWLQERGYRTEILAYGLLGRLFPEVRPAEHNRWLIADT
jgi:methyltransferase FkbM-like protein